MITWELLRHIAENVGSKSKYSQFPVVINSRDYISRKSVPNAGETCPKRGINIETISGSRMRNTGKRFRDNLLPSYSTYAK